MLARRREARRIGRVGMEELLGLRGKNDLMNGGAPRMCRSGRRGYMKRTSL